MEDADLTANLFYIVEFLFLILLGYSSMGRFKSFLIEVGMKATNYRGKSLPIGMGFVIYAFFLLHTLWASVVEKFTDIPASLISFHFLWSGGIVFFLGWLDDSLGTKEHKGLKGHFTAWFDKGKITTGLLKAAGISMASFLLAMKLKTGWVDIVLTATFISLTSNMMNLLDLRPGRAWKGGFFLAAIGLATYGSALALDLILPLLAAAWILFPDDVKGESMLGDTGSNLLGFWIGAWVAFSASNLFLTVGILVLLTFHWYSEKRSITKWIEQHKMIHAIDRWGRK
jgi:UDP-GlcNAc:undecaprenyl-phosphate GlcNAc-1-phosphate transferase